MRIAGNFVNTDILGSMEFACKVAGSKAIVVLGHTSCGAVKGACDDVELGILTSMLSNIKPAVHRVAGHYEDRSSKNAGFVQKVADTNVALAIDAIKERSSVLKEMLDKGQHETGYAYLQQARSIDPTSSLPEVTLRHVKVGVDRATRMPMIEGEIWNPKNKSIGRLSLSVELYDSKKLQTIFKKETRIVDEFVRPLKGKQSKQFSF